MIVNPYVDAGERRKRADFDSFQKRYKEMERLYNESIKGQYNNPAPSEGTKMIREPDSSKNLEPTYVRSTLWQMKLALAETDGLDGVTASAYSDAEFFVREAIEALNKVID